MCGIFIVHPIDCDMVAVMELVASLFQGKGTIVSPLPKPGRGLPTAALFLQMIKERVIGSADALHDILNGLRSKQPPMGVPIHLLEGGQKYLQPIGREVFSKPLVVSAMQGNTVVPDLGRDVDLPVQAG